MYGMRVLETLIVLTHDTYTHQAEAVLVARATTGASAGPTCTAMSASASAGLSLRFVFCCSNVEVIVVVENDVMI